MRIYSSFQDAINETTRDVAEMGIRVHPATYQDKYVAENPDFDALELQNYGYTITAPNSSHLSPVQPWADAEWAERLQGINGVPVNPGTAWLLRENVWRQFLQEDGVFAYTYAERFAQFTQVLRVIERLKKDPDSRQGYISVWKPSDVKKLGGVSRVPCSLGYQIQIRGGHVNMLYEMRSCDFKTHYQNDIYLAVKLHEYLANQIGRPIGMFTHFVHSLHMFKKDAEGVF